MIQFTYFNNVLKNKLSFADSLESYTLYFDILGIIHDLRNVFLKVLL